MEAAYFSAWLATNLSPPAVWSRLTIVPSFLNGSWQLPVPFSTGGARFFRLQAP